MLHSAHHLPSDAKPATERQTGMLVMHEPVRRRRTIVSLEEVHATCAERLLSVVSYKIVLLIERRRDVERVDQLLDLCPTQNFQVPGPIGHDGVRTEFFDAQCGMVRGLGRS